MEKLDAELDHHLKIAGRATSRYIEKKRIFWDSVLDLVRKHNGGKITRPVLEIGNGPFGAFLAIDGKDTLCIDPLNNEYKKFPHFEALKSTFIDSDIESAGRLGPFGTIISYNALDHVDDVEKTIGKMVELADENAILLIGVDYYPSRLLKKIMHTFRKQIDTPHPHHFDFCQLKEMFGKRFEILEITDNSGFKAVEEELPGSKKSFFSEFRERPIGAVSGAAYRGIYFVGKKFGMGGKEANLGIKKMAVFVMRKKSGF